MIEPIKSLLRFKPDDFYKNFKYSIDINSKLEVLSILPNRTQNILCNSKIIKIENKIGQILINFLNYFNNLEEIINNFIKEIKNLYGKPKNEDFLIKCRNFESDIKKKIPKISEIILSEFNNFEYYHFWIIYEYKGILEDNIQLLEEELEEESDELKEIFQLKKIKEQYSLIQNTNYTFDSYIEYLRNLLMKLTVLYNKCRKSFTENTDNYTKTKTKFYNSSDLNIPSVQIYFDNSIHPKLTHYEYSFINIEDLLNVSLYHIILNKNVISKCKNCEDYFIPKNRNDEVYCDKKINKTQTCKDIGKYKSFKYKQYSENPTPISYFFHKTLNDRLKNNDNYKKEYIKFKENYQKVLDKKYSNNKKREESIMKFLTDFDKKFQEKYPITKGRKYTSQKYWI